MCGIIGYAGDQNAASILLKGLEHLEYRGYDSAGLATVCDGKLHLRKGAGKLEEVQLAYNLTELPGNCGIGHVRWATHGGVNQANAHPHYDCDKQIALVHNGIIENHQQIRRLLEPEHTFVSDTDTEIIVHLIEHHLKRYGGLLEAVRAATAELKGSYALVATSAAEPGKVVAYRNGNPLVVGLGDSENFIASDYQAFIDHTRRVLYIEDGETVVLAGPSVQLLDRDGNTLQRMPVNIEGDYSGNGKNGFEYYMLKEIFEQPQAIRCSLLQDVSGLNRAASLIRESSSVVFTACGTSRYAALIGRYLFSSIAHCFSDVIMASEFGYFADAVNSSTLVIAVSQSGETADVLEGVKEAKARGARILSVTNTPGSSLVRISDQVLYLNCGPEIGVPATKSFVSQLSVFYLLAYTMAGRQDEVKHKLDRISAFVEDNLLLNNVYIPGIAQKQMEKDKFYYIARGINFAVAGEAALKLKEVAYVHAEGMPAGELKHGTLALVEEGTPVIAIAPVDSTRAHMMSNISEVKARGAYVIGVSDRPDPLFDAFIEVPSVEEVFYPMVSIIPLQLLALYSALCRGLDPDKPRNLAKSVTVK